MNTQSQNSERELILNALDRWIRQRPGLEFGNYGDWSAYRSEMRSITKDLHHARTLLAAIRWRDSITAEKLKEAFRAFSGRLSWVPAKVWQCAQCDCVSGVAQECCGEQMRQCGKLEYCTGQYWPTEYRRAVCAVCASALWDYFRANMPKGVLMHNSETGETLERYNGMRAGDYLRAQARKEFGRAIADRWFN